MKELGKVTALSGLHSGMPSRRLAEERFDVHKINQVLFQKMGL